jgi:hypothetical protein
MRNGKVILATERDDSSQAMALSSCEAVELFTLLWKTRLSVR